MAVKCVACGTPEQIAAVGIIHRHVSKKYLKNNTMILDLVFTLN